MRQLLLGFALVCVVGVNAQETPQQKPNVIVIISDDAGYGDFSFQGGKEFPTPHIDSLARDGVRFSEGYVTASVCSPSRAGLITGRYQQRFGHEFNIPPVYSETNGLPLDEVMLPALLKKVGYQTIGLGKWHLGYADHFHPMSRGFTDWYGFLQGARKYFPMEGSRLNRLLDGRKPIKETFEYLTDELGRKAAEYVRNAEGPFFMYLSFNAVHTPMHAKDSDLEKVTGIKGKRRKILSAMTRSMDDAVGVVLKSLKETEKEANTLVFFVNDNGGATSNSSRNGTLKGHKGTPFEGGIRVPFLARFPDRITKGSVFNHPVSTLDIFATALAVAGGKKPEKALDGVDLLPYLKDGVQAKAPHEYLFWKKRPNWAVRSGDWKLVYYGGKKSALQMDAPALYNIAKDPSEKTDCSETEPKRKKELLAAYNEWSKQHTPSRWGGTARRQKKRD